MTTPRPLQGHCKTLLDVDDGVDPARCSVKVTYSDLGLALACTLYLADTTDRTP